MKKEISSPLVSIIMPLYNAQNYVAEAIQSVINQTYKNWELIIVNDGSTDDSLLVAKQFESDKIKIFSQENKGQCGANNYGYSLSNGSYIKFFDADDILSTQTLEFQFKAINNKDTDIATCTWGRFYNNDIGTFKYNRETVWADLKPIDWLKKSWKNAQPMMQCGIFLIPRKVLTKSGLWNEKLSLINDFEFFTRVILAAENIKFTESGCLYYRSGILGTLSAQKNRNAVISAFNSINWGTQKFLEFCTDNETKLCCANIWQNFIYEFYYQQPDLAKQAELKVEQLGGSNLEFPCGGYTKILYSLFGWKATQKLKKYLIKVLKH